MSPSAFGFAARINWKELRRRAMKLALKKLGHAIEDWVRWAHSETPVKSE
jgi:hypothetical protein